MKARDLMIPLQDYLGPDDTLRHAVNLLKTARRGEEKIGVKGLPVVDEETGKVVGLLSMRDILKAVWPSYMSLSDLGQFTWDGMLEEMARKNADKKVKMLMTRDVMTVKEDASLMECVDYMVRKNIKRLPVTDKSGKLIGMLYERDVFFAIAKALLDDKDVQPAD